MASISQVIASIEGKRVFFFDFPISFSQYIILALLLLLPTNNSFEFFKTGIQYFTWYQKKKCEALLVSSFLSRTIILDMPEGRGEEGNIKNEDGTGEVSACGSISEEDQATAATLTNS